MGQRLGNYLGAALLWLFAWLPYRTAARFGEWLGGQLFRLKSRRREVVLTNLRLCFPELGETERFALARAHFRCLFRSFAERGLVWLGRADKVLRYVEIQSDVDLADRAPRLYISMHMVGIEAGAVAQAAQAVALGQPDTMMVYMPMKNAWMDRFVAKGRGRFGSTLVARGSKAGGLTLLRGIRRGAVVQISPDMDFGLRDSVFVPFFGVPACTLTVVSRLAQQTGAQVVPIVTLLKPDYEGYVAKIHPPLPDFPSGDVEADARAMNAFFEGQIRAHPEQYYWVHKRFKTRPDGEPPVY